MSETPQETRSLLQNWSLLIGLVLIANLFAGTPPRIVPGGPFVSITGDVLPILVSAFVVWRAFVRLRTKRLSVSILSVLLIIAATVAFGRVLIVVVEFWNLPHARGDFFGL